MALVLKDRVKETTTTTGTGTVTLAGAVAGFDAFSVVGDGNTTYYAIVAQTPGEWEVGLGTYTSSGTTLSRDTVLASSNSGSAVDFGAGTKDVFVTYPAEKSVNQDQFNSDVDTHLNTSTATSNQVLSWTGSDYDWVDQSGGGGGALTIDNKTANYTVVAGDLGKIINCTSGTFTVSLDAAATLGSGFNCWVWNTGTGAITIDPNGSETIEGRSTLILRIGEGTQIVCDGTNWLAGDKKTTRGFSQNISPGGSTGALGAEATAIGYSSAATGNYSIAIGAFSSNATGGDSIALGSNTTASGTSTTAIGRNSASQGSQAVNGGGAMALGGSRASGTDSFAAAVANNTSSYGATGNNSIAVGRQARATTSYATALGASSSGLGAVSSGAGAVALGGSYASGQDSFAAANGDVSGTYGAQGADSVAIGDRAKATATSAFAFGLLSVADANDSIAFGNRSATNGIVGKYAFGAGSANYLNGLLILRNQTSDATPTVLTSQATAASTTNQVILPNNSAYAFSGIIVARQQASGGTASAAWKVEGLIRREGSAGTTVLVNSALTVIDNTPGWTLALSADTTNGGLAITATGAAATNIRWVATIQTSEVTY